MRKYGAIFIATVLALTVPTLPAQAAVSIKMAIVYDIGGRGDHGINDAAAKGIDAIKKKFGLTALSVREMVTNGSESDRESRLQFLASAHYNLIIAVGAGFAKAISVVALTNPSTQFALINDASVGNLNISDMVFSNADGAYLAGVLAGAATKSNKVGFIAPTVMSPFFADFQLGVASIKPKAVAISQIVDTLPAVATQTLISQGADVIFSQWSTTSEVQDTIAKKTTAKHPIFLIGVDPDQYFLLDKSNAILIGAVLKRVDTAVEDVMNSAIKKESVLDVLNGAQGIFGHMYTIKDGGVSITFTKLGNAYSSKVTSAIAAIKSGKVKLP